VRDDVVDDGGGGGEAYGDHGSTNSTHVKATSRFGGVFNIKEHVEVVKIPDEDIRGRAPVPGR